MSTQIERFLYRQFGVHGIIDLRFEMDSLSLVVTPFIGHAPHVDLKRALGVRFDNFKLKYIDTSFADDDDRQMPWDLIGFDSSSSGSQWDFCFHCDAMEVSFVSDWPVVASEIV